MQHRLESLLARLLTDDAFRRQFLHDPAAVAKQAGLSAEECAAVAAMPMQDLKNAAWSYGRKRAAKRPYRRRSWWPSWIARA
jgi:putative modified peptide